MAVPPTRTPTGLEEHPALPRDVLIFLIQLSVALNKTRAYPPGHPVLSAALASLLGLPRHACHGGPCGCLRGVDDPLPSPPIPTEADQPPASAPQPTAGRGVPLGPGAYPPANFRVGPAARPSGARLG